MSDTVELWRQIHESFKCHITRIDSNAQAAMERVAMKCLGLTVRRSFNALNCTVREETLETASLHELKLYHPRAEPRHPGGPIVVLVYEGKKFVIDGNNRVSVWIKRKMKGPFTAIVVEPHAMSSPDIKEGG